MSREYFKLIPAVYLFLRRDNEVLFLKRANTGYQDGKYSVPAGHIDGGELATAAMCREAREETGIEINPNDLKFVHVSHRLNDSPDQERVDFFFEALVWKGEITNMEPSKCDDLSWHSIDNLPANIIPHVRLILQKYLSDDHYSEYSSEPV
jgi:8-oxo-dGTP diphosphatase